MNPNPRREKGDWKGQGAATPLYLIRHGARGGKPCRRTSAHLRLRSDTGGNLRLDRGCSLAAPPPRSSIPPHPLPPLPDLPSPPCLPPRVPAGTKNATRISSFVPSPSPLFASGHRSRPRPRCPSHAEAPLALGLPKEMENNWKISRVASNPRPGLPACLLRKSTAFSCWIAARASVEPSLPLNSSLGQHLAEGGRYAPDSPSGGRRSRFPNSKPRKCPSRK